MELFRPKYGSNNTTKQVCVYKSSMNILSSMKTVEFELLPCVSKPIFENSLDISLTTKKSVPGKKLCKLCNTTYIVT